MARATRQPSLETRTARARLPRRHEPYWQRIDRGLYLGYRKGERGGAWMFRRYEGGRYQKGALTERPDDVRDADGRGVLDYFQAQARVRELAAAAGKESRAVRARAYTIGEVIDEYLRWMEAHRRTADRTRQSASKHIDAKLRGTPAAELSTAAIRRWHEKLARTDSEDPDTIRARRSTANRVLTILKAALNFGFREGLIESDSAWRRAKPFPAVESPRIVFLEVAEAKRLLNACPPDFRRLARGALLSGARYGELIRAEVGDYLADGRSLRLRFTKNGRVRIVPLTDEGAAFFEEITAGRAASERLFLRKDGEPWARTQQSRRMAEAVSAAKIEKPATFHALRHTYAAALAMRGVSMRVLAELLGHSDTRITERHYAHLAPSYVAETVRANLPSFGTRRGKVRRMKARAGVTRDG